jgi:alanine-synthesizing transaminase
MQILQSNKLQSVCYDIRGAVFEEAKKLESLGQTILKLNIGNPAPFGFSIPPQITQAIEQNFQKGQGYVDSRGILPAREAILNYYQHYQIPNITTADIYIGNGVSELIVMVNQALLNNGDEVLIPSPDYPLWTAAASLAGGKAVHYLCEEENNWQPSLADIQSKITDKTKAIVIINPNNPTGAVYSKELLQKLVKIAEDNHLVIFSDEIYDKILYDDAIHIPTATLVSKTLCITFNGLSKAYLAAGLRVGWMLISGNKMDAGSYLSGLEILSNMRLCSNAPNQYGIEVALNGHQDIKDLTAAGGRLLEQRNAAFEVIQNSQNLSSHKPMGALYNFVKIKKPLIDDEKFTLDLLKAHKILIVQGTAFNWHQPDHFRIVTLPKTHDLQNALQTIDIFLNNYTQ